MLFTKYIFFLWKFLVFLLEIKKQYFILNPKRFYLEVHAFVFLPSSIPFFFLQPRLHYSVLDFHTHHFPYEVGEMKCNASPNV